VEKAPVSIISALKIYDNGYLTHSLLLAKFSILILQNYSEVHLFSQELIDKCCNYPDRTINYFLFPDVTIWYITSWSSLLNN